MEPKEPTREGYVFGGWYNGTELYDFATEVTADITLTAKWNAGDVMLGAGTKEDPYTIANAAQLLDFSAKINAGETGYNEAFYELIADIDMTDAGDYVPAGKMAVSEEDTELDYRFKGKFEGNGYTIANLSMEKVIKKGVGFVGLFGETYRAQIKNLTLENFAYNVESYSSDSTVGAYIGGIAGYAELSDFTNVTVSGTVTTSMMEANPTHIGGLAGTLHASMSDDQAYIAYVENCYVDLTTVIAEDGEQHESGSAGGLFGYIQTYQSAVAILNCATAGTIRGGMYAGGLVGSMGSYVSIINSTSSASVRGMATEVTYTGGLVGQCLYDAVIMDSYSTGAVTGKQASSTTYESYVGGIIGYAKSNSYVQYYEAGTAVINCYYSGKVTTNRANKNALGTVIDASNVDATFMQNTLGWSANCWDMDEVKPTDVLASEVCDTYTVTLESKDETVETKSYTYSQTSGYALLGELTSLEHQSPELFYAWELALGETTRFYLPVMKDITVTARWQDVSAIVGAYKGTGLLNDAGTPIDAGSFVLDDEGGVQWIRQSVSTGSYTYDGEHLHFEIGANGEQTATLVGTTLTFEEDAGMTGYVTYSFAKYDPVILGEFVSDTGDLITIISEEKLSFQSTKIKSGDFVSAPYTVEGNLLTVNTSGTEKIGSYFSSFTIDISDQKQIKVNAVAKTAGGYSLTDETFKRGAAVDYSAHAFVGDYNVVYLGSSSSNRYGVETFTIDRYVMSFLKNGTVLYGSAISSNPTPGRYYYSEEISAVKIVLDGYACEFVFDSEEGIFHGILNRGDTSKRAMILTPVSDGELTAYAYGDRDTALYVTETGNYYYIEQKVYDDDATITSFDEKGRVVINGKSYQRMIYSTPGEERIYCNLLLIGEEEGEYTLDGKTFVLDGIGGISGDKVGKYYVYDTLIVVLCSDDELFGFDYQTAQAANGAVTLAQVDGKQGVWYLDHTHFSSGEFTEKYYKLVIDGYGNATLLYLYDDGDYHYNWGGWGTYVASDYGVTVRFNEYHTATFTFYYDGNLLYTKSDWLYGECGFYKEGYTGSMTPPEFPTTWTGSYADASDEAKTAIFNLRADMTGSYKGYPISSVVYDGDKTLYFSANGQNYQVYFDTTFVLTGNDEEITLTYAGAVTEVFPAALVGTWSGEFTGIGVTTGEVRSIRMDADGTVTYIVSETAGTQLSQVNYDGGTNVITAYMQNGDIDFIMTYDAENEQIQLTMRDIDNREWKATLIKEAA